jgi:hypothetical protein
MRTIERRTMEGRTTEITTWTCENCRNANAADRKRCTDCGTTRH